MKGYGNYEEDYMRKMAMMALAVIMAALLVFPAAAQEAEEAPVEAAAETARANVIPAELVGRWTLMAIGTKITFEFTADGKMWQEVGGQKSNATSDISVDGKTLRVVHSNGQSGTAQYKVSKNVLSLSKLKGASGFPMGKFKKEA
jgi:hypothetical protein